MWTRTLILQGSPRDVATVRIGDHPYVLLGTFSDQPLKIFNVTDPSAKPKAVAGSDTGDISIRLKLGTSSPH